MKKSYKIPPLPALPDELHKGSAGRILCIGGSKGLSGSIILSAKAAIRTGAGLVTIALPNEIGDIAATASLESMTIYCSSKNGHLNRNSWKNISKYIFKTDNIVFGPGIGRDKDIEYLLKKSLEANKPTVIDADGLFAFAKLKTKFSQPIVLTPHIGEMNTLIGYSLPENFEERKKIAINYALQKKIILVLKSHRTIVTDGIQIYEEKAGNPGMATGGSGDVLAGTIASFLLMPDQAPFINVVRAVHAHSLSGDLATKSVSQRFLNASDIIDYYGIVLKSLEIK